MPRPLPSLPKTDRDIYAALADEPLAPDTPLALADSAEEAMADHRAALLRRSRLALFELLRGKALTDAECAEALSDPKEQDRRISKALGAPEASSVLPDLRTPEGVRSQYEFQRLLLASLNLLEDRRAQLGIIGIDAQFHTMPSLEAIRTRLQTPDLQRKIEQGFDTLLLVPFALPLHRLVQAWRRGLLRNEHLLEPYGRLHHGQPVWLWEESYGLRSGKGPDEDGRLVYFPQRFAQDHDGRTKTELLTADPPAAWQALLVEGAVENIPRPGEGRTIGGRPRIEAGRTGRESLASLPAGETGWTPETYVTAFSTALERSGRPLDTQTTTYLVASYLPGPASLPFAGWDGRNHGTCLGRRFPDLSVASRGVRAAVRVL